MFLLNILWKKLYRGKCSFTNFERLAWLFNSHWHNSSIVAGKILQQSLARFFNSGWHNSSIVTGAIVQQSLARLFNSRWHDIQQSLAWLFNSHWHDYSTVAAMTLQQSLARLFNSQWHDSSRVTGTILQQSLERFFNRCWHNSLTVAGKIFSFFYAGRILQQWCSLLKNRAMYQEYDTWPRFGIQSLIWYYPYSVDRSAKVCRSL